jgi:hypothetical protein
VCVCVWGGDPLASPLSLHHSWGRYHFLDPLGGLNPFSIALSQGRRGPEASNTKDPWRVPTTFETEAEWGRAVWGGFSGIVNSFRATL